MVVFSGLSESLSEAFQTSLKQAGGDFKHSFLMGGSTTTLYMQWNVIVLCGVILGTEDIVHTGVVLIEIL